MISDFESWTYLYGLTHRLPILSIDNMKVREGQVARLNKLRAERDVVVVLSACQSAQGERAGDLQGVADTLLAGDLGCLMNMAGKLQREGSAVRVRHVAEVLAGMGDQPAIGEPEAGAR